jgi:hypothetical protein
MPQTVEISLRIPSLRVPGDANANAPQTIANNDVRFSRHIEVDKIPKAGEVLDMSVDTRTFKCTVVRSDWHHEKNLFVVACRYANRSISQAEYQALMDSADWQIRPLL